MEINEIIGSNLAKLRKEHNLTQREVAAKLDFSDKSVSKWESGESIPGVDVLVKLAQLYEVKLDYFVTEEQTAEQQVQKVEEKPEKPASRYRYSRLTISLMAILLVWVAAVCVFIFVQPTYPNVWIAFVWALVASVAMAIVFNSIWGELKHTFWFISMFIWFTLAAIFLQLVIENIVFWQLFLLGVPLQLITILCASLIFKNKRTDPATIRARREYQKEKALQRKAKREKELQKRKEEKEQKKQKEKYEQEAQASQNQMQEQRDQIVEAVEKREKELCDERSMQEILDQISEKIKEKDLDTMEDIQNEIENMEKKMEKLDSQDLKEKLKERIENMKEYVKQQEKKYEKELKKS